MTRGDNKVSGTKGRTGRKKTRARLLGHLPKVGCHRLEEGGMNKKILFSTVEGQSEKKIKVLFRGELREDTVSLKNKHLREKGTENPARTKLGSPGGNGMSEFFLGRGGIGNLQQPRPGIRVPLSSEW